MPYQSKWQDLPTEAINPATLAIDTMPVSEIIDVISNEDKKVVAAVHRERERIALGVDLIVGALRKGGRLLLVGAGTSGRLGVLEAAECPPTFGTRPGLVQAIMAGGRRSVFRSREGAEDDAGAAARAVRRRVRRGDVVVGISASGVTPFVRGALAAARGLRAITVLVQCSASRGRVAADVIIRAVPGPEVLAGSTRLKAGTATKLVLNTLTTASMTRLGKVYGNRMIDLQPRSAKLRARAERLVAEIAGVRPDRARRALRDARGRVRLAVVMARRNLPASAAARALRAAGGSLRSVLEPRASR
jgi:N-acetylmuramic acid 6-phosphate etherase